MINRLQYSKQGQDLTKQFESCRLTAYPDVKGVMTIGWGHVGREVKAGYTITQVQADAQLVVDYQNAVTAVNQLVTFQLNQEEFDAIVDLVFNIGVGAFGTSTMRALLNQGDIAGAALEFARWDHASGQVVAGLLRRRLAERNEFTS